MPSNVVLTPPHPIPRCCWRRGPGWTPYISETNGANTSSGIGSMMVDDWLEIYLPFSQIFQAIAGNTQIIPNQMPLRKGSLQISMVKIIVNEMRRFQLKPADLPMGQWCLQISWSWILKCNICRPTTFLCTSAGFSWNLQISNSIFLIVRSAGTMVKIKCFTSQMIWGPFGVEDPPVSSETRRYPEHRIMITIKILILVL